MPESNDTKIGPKIRKRKRDREKAEDGPTGSGTTAFRLQEWPSHFTQLAETHAALNLVYTFCCTRKHLPTTFQNLRTAVEGNTKRPLTVEAVSQIKFLMPDTVLFSYVDEEYTQVQASLADRSFQGFDEPLREKKQQDDSRGLSKQVLLFEYLDGDLKRKPTPKPNDQVPRRRNLSDRLKAPEFSHSDLLKLISKRNDKFHKAVNAFLETCYKSDVDPVESITIQQREHVPNKQISDENLAISSNSESEIPKEIPKDRKPIVEIIKDVTTTASFYTDQIVVGGELEYPSQDPVYGELDFPLSQCLVDALYNVKNIARLYSHQVSALNDIFYGNNVVVSTSTSSGKSIIYQVPFLHRLQFDPECRALLIFPTKALAQDQKASLARMTEFMGDLVGNAVVETYDGDTPMESRRQIREEARAVLTNPDMLHLNILPNEEQWRNFLKNLRFVVLDELHVYNGLFGSHVAFVIRRLRRICSAIGNNNIIFISCSATVEKPEEHMKKLIGVPEVKLTTIDGSPSGKKTFLCWNCPLKDPNDPRSGRVSPVIEAARLFVELILRGVRTIVFCRVRKACELTLDAIKHELIERGRIEISNRVMSYRGGYSSQDRRRIEREMFNGLLLGIVATTALELGVDIGALDAVVMVGFPYSISNLRQQSGRAGRRNKDSLSVLIGDRFPLDQHYMSNPNLIKTMPNPTLHLDLENILILEGHIQCAAFEMPISLEADERYFGSQLGKLITERLIRDERGFYHCHERFRPYPSQHVAIRDTEDDYLAVVDITQGRNIVLEQVEPTRAVFTLYEGAIFLHQGFKYLVREFNPDKRIAKVELVKVDWITQQRDFTDIDPIETEAIRRIPGSPYNAYFGVIKIKAVVFGYFKIDRRGRVLDACEVETPPIEIFSKGMWLDVPKLALDILKIKKLNIAGAIHAAEHAILSLLPNFVISSLGDVRTECKAPQKEFAQKETTRKRPARLTFYDAKGGSGGSGITTKAFEFIDILLRMAMERVVRCGCQEGCPECVAFESCKEENAVISKVGSIVVLKSILGEDIDPETIPEGPENLAPVGIETVILAEEIPSAVSKRRLIGIPKEKTTTISS